MIGQQWRKVGWSVRILVVWMLVLVIASLLALPSMLFPYVASPHYRWFCYFVLAPSFFVIFCLAALRSIYRQRHDQNGKLSKVNWVKVLLGVALFCIAFSYELTIDLAIPSKIFAQAGIDIPVTVDYLDGFRLNYDYWTWIYFDRDGHTDRFMWTRSDPLLSTLKHGDCIMLHARKWPLGIYVDSISRSNACQSTSGTESE